MSDGNWLESRSNHSTTPWLHSDNLNCTPFPITLLLDEGVQIQIQRANRGSFPILTEKGYLILIEVVENTSHSSTTYIQILTAKMSHYSAIFPLRGTQIQILLPQEWTIEDEFFKNASMLDAFISQSLKLSDAIQVFIQKSCCFQKDKLAFWASFYALLIELKSCLHESEKLPLNDLKKLEEIAKLLSNNFTISPPTMSELALKVGFSVSKLKILFKNTYGKSLYQFHQQAKMAYAAKLLQTQRYTISQVSYKIGYRNSIKFIKIFKKHFGVTPGEFKKIRSDF